jgi:hypothetical protein
LQKSTTATLVNEKENSGRVGASTAASRKHATVATKAIGESGTGLSFQLCDESKTQQVRAVRYANNGVLPTSAVKSDTHLCDIASHKTL